METTCDAPRIAVSISVEGEPWGTCNFRSWQEIIDYLQPYADGEGREKTKNTTNKHDEEALRLLKLFSQNVNGMIECMQDGDGYNPGAIGGIIDIDVLLRVRDELVRARMEDNETETEEFERDNNVE